MMGMGDHYREKDAVKRLNEIAEDHKDGPSEGGHVEADEILCRLLRDLGYGDAVDAYERIRKWYA